MLYINMYLLVLCHWFGATICLSNLERYGWNQPVPSICKIQHSMNLGFILRTYSINVSGNPTAIPASFQVGHVQILNGMRKISGKKWNICANMQIHYLHPELFLLCFFIAKIYIICLNELSDKLMYPFPGIGLQLILTTCCMWSFTISYAYICVYVYINCF